MRHSLISEELQFREPHFEPSPLDLKLALHKRQRSRLVLAVPEQPGKLLNVSATHPSPPITQSPTQSIFTRPPFTPHHRVHSQIISDRIINRSRSTLFQRAHSKLCVPPSPSAPVFAPIFPIFPENSIPPILLTPAIYQHNSN